MFDVCKSIDLISAMKRSSNEAMKSSRGRKTFELENYIVNCEEDGISDISINGETIIKDKKTNNTIFHGLYFRSEKNGFGI